MKSILILALTFTFTTANSQSPDQISIGQVANIHSKLLNEDRRIWVYNPAENDADNTERYPVLYLLDAEEHFYSTVGMIKQMRGRWPAIIVVGITNTDRFRDLTPIIAGSNSKGGDDFMSFIEKELMPHIDSVYPTAPYQIFSGHSLGGLTVIHTLLNKHSLFNAYIAIDPSLWWNNQQLVKDVNQKGRNFNNTSLFIGRAKNMPPDMDTLAALEDTSQYTLIYRSVAGFIKNLKKVDKTGLLWDTKFYPEESHGTVELIGQYDGLKFLFNYYQFRTSLFELNPDMNIDSALTAHFENISRRMGYVVQPSEGLVNNLGYTCMGLKKWDKAETFFKMNIKNYPGHANGYDSLGDFYQATGDYKKAIENFEKALTLGNDGGTKGKLEYLKAMQ